MNALELLNDHLIKRRAYADLADTDNPDTDKLLDIDTELRSIESDLAAAIKEQANAKQDIQFSDLVTNASVGAIYQATVDQTETRGAERELQAELNLRSNQIPISLLNDPHIEQRAVTPGVTTQGNTSEVLPLVFPMSMAAFLSIPQPVVPVGQSSYPALTTGAEATTPAENAAVAESTGAFSLTNLSPKRIQASFFYSREDSASFAGMADALRQNLMQALSDKLDIEVLANVIADGTEIDNSEQLIALAGAEKAFNQGVEGLYATTYADLRVVISPTLFQLLAAERVQNTDVTAIDLLSRGSGLRVSTHLPAIASKKQKQIIRRGTMLAAVTPIWEGVTLIPDEITKAANGQIVITAVMLFNTDVLRSAAFYIPNWQVTE